MTNSIQEKPENCYRSVGFFQNKTKQNLVIFLEIDCEEIHLSPEHEIELFIENDDDYFPMSFLYHPHTIQIYPKYGCPIWYFKFQGKMYEAGYTILSELE